MNGTRISSKVIATPNPKIEVRTATIATPNPDPIETESIPVTPTRSKPPSAPLLSPKAGAGSASSSLVASIPRSRASSNGSGVENRALRSQLIQRRQECPQGDHKFFVPANALQDLVVVDTVVSNMTTESSNLNEDEILERAQKVCQYATKLFAALVYVKKGPSICSLLDEGITDDDLPLVRKKNDGGLFKLLRQSGVPIQTFEEWDSDEREEFDRVQRWMTAPIFKPLGHYELDDKTILPFVPLEGMEDIEKKSKQGGYGEVYPVQVHPAHHKFWTTHPDVCLISFNHPITRG